MEQFTKGSAVFRVTGHFSTPPKNWTVRAFLQLIPRLSNDFTAAWLTFTFPQLFAVAATLKSIDYNVAMTFILNNNNNNNNTYAVYLKLSWQKSHLNCRKTRLSHQHDSSVDQTLSVMDQDHVNNNMSMVHSSNVMILQHKELAELQFSCHLEWDSTSTTLRRLVLTSFQLTCCHCVMLCSCVRQKGLIQLGSGTVWSLT